MMKNIKFCLVIWFLFPLTGIIHGQDKPEQTRQRSSSYTFYSPDKEPPLKQKNAKPLRLLQSPRMKGVALVDYAISQITIDTEKRILDGGASSGSGGWSSKSESGFTRHIPRIKITAKNKPIPESSLLVIEYFSSQVLNKSNIHKECVEHISLPYIGVQKSVTVDANGVEFYKSEHKSSGSWGYSSQHGEGLELYGLIVSLFIDSELIIQMCSSSTLNKECTDTIPSPKQYENLRMNNYMPSTP